MCIWHTAEINTEDTQSQSGFLYFQQLIVLLIVLVPTCYPFVTHGNAPYHPGYLPPQVSEAGKFGKRNSEWGLHLVPPPRRRRLHVRDLMIGGTGVGVNDAVRWRLAGPQSSSPVGGAVSAGGTAGAVGLGLGLTAT